MMVKFIFILIVFLLFIWRIKRGFHNGIMGEIVTILSVAVALVCVALILFAVTIAMAREVSALTVCIIALILLGTVFKICSLIFRPVLALSNISLFEGFNKMLGAVMGALEACVLTGLLYYALGYVGVYVF